MWSSTGWISPYNDNKLIGGVLGYLDYSGSSMVHALGGMAALVAVFVLGPRHGRFGIDGEVVELEGTVVCPPPPFCLTADMVNLTLLGAFCCPPALERPARFSHVPDGWRAHMRDRTVFGAVPPIPVSDRSRF